MHEIDETFRGEWWLALVKFVQRRIVFEEVLAGTEIPGG